MYILIWFSYFEFLSFRLCKVAQITECYLYLLLLLIHRTCGNTCFILSSMAMYTEHKFDSTQFYHSDISLYLAFYSLTEYLLTSHWMLKCGRIKKDYFITSLEQKSFKCISYLDIFSLNKNYSCPGNIV